MRLRLLQRAVSKDLWIYFKRQQLSQHRAVGVDVTARSPEELDGAGPFLKVSVAKASSASPRKERLNLWPGLLDHDAEFVVVLSVMTRRHGEVLRKVSDEHS